MGSSSWVGAHVPFKKTSVFDQIAAVPCPAPSKYLMMAMQSSGAANIAFLKDRMVYHDDGLYKGEPTPDVYAVLDEFPHARRPVRKAWSICHGSSASAARWTMPRSAPASST